MSEVPVTHAPSPLPPPAVPSEVVLLQRPPLVRKIAPPDVATVPAVRVQRVHARSEVEIVEVQEVRIEVESVREIQPKREESESSADFPLPTPVVSPMLAANTTEEAAVLEMPEPPPPPQPEERLQPTSRRVEIQIGEERTEVRITVHERAGDVSIRFETDKPSLARELQSGVGTLIEALRREQIPLGNLDFTSIQAGSEDLSRESKDSRHTRARRVAALQRFLERETEAHDTINIRV